MLRFDFMPGPWENATEPTLVRDCPDGGDYHILARLKVHNADALHELCALANEALEARDTLSSPLVVDDLSGEGE